MLLAIINHKRTRSTTVLLTLLFGGWRWHGLALWGMEPKTSLLLAWWLGESEGEQPGWVVPGLTGFSTPLVSRFSG
jgi:hypothetical protein